MMVLHCIYSCFHSSELGVEAFASSVLDGVLGASGNTGDEGSATGKSGDEGAAAELLLGRSGVLGGAAGGGNGGDVGVGSGTLGAGPFELLAASAEEDGPGVEGCP